MSKGPRWYLINDGNFGYSVEYTEDPDNSNIGQMGGWSDYDTFIEAKNAGLECLQNDIREARARLVEFRYHYKRKPKAEAKS